MYLRLAAAPGTLPAGLLFDFVWQRGTRVPAAPLSASGGGSRWRSSNNPHLRHRSLLLLQCTVKSLHSFSYIFTGCREASMPTAMHMLARPQHTQLIEHTHSKNTHTQFTHHRQDPVAAKYQRLRPLPRRAAYAGGTRAPRGAAAAARPAVLGRPARWELGFVCCMLCFSVLAGAAAGPAVLGRPAR